MRKITFGRSVIFAVCPSLAIIVGAWTTAALLGLVAVGISRDDGLAVGLMSIYVYALVLYRSLPLVAPGYSDSRIGSGELWGGIPARPISPLSRLASRRNLMDSDDLGYGDIHP